MSQEKPPQPPLPPGMEHAPDLGKVFQQKKMQMQAIVGLRLNLAASNYNNFMRIEYEIARHQQATFDPLLHPEQDSTKLTIDARPAAALAIQAADVFLIAYGLVDPPKPPEKTEKGLHLAGSDGEVARE